MTDSVTPTCSSGHSHSLWHTFVAPQTGRMVFWTLGTNFDTVTAVYKTTPTTANQMACFNTISASNDWDGGNVNVIAGTRYYVLIAAVGAGSSVDSSSQIIQVYYSNNARVQSFLIPGSGTYSNIQDHIENASNLYYASGTCGTQNYGVYYKFRPTVSGRYEFSTNGSSYDTNILLDDGAGFSNCNEDISNNNYNSRIRPTLVAGTTYYIMIGQTSIAWPIQTDDMVLSLRVRKM
jgi:hypothetical protein